MPGSLRAVSTNADAPGPEQEPQPAAEVEAAPEPPETAPEPATPAEPEPEAAEQPQAEVAPEQPRTEAGSGQPSTDAQKPAGKPKPKRPRARKPRSRRPNVPKDLPRSRAPLPLDELRDASRATLDLFGREGIREAFLILAHRERNDISELIARDEDHRPRTRNIANGSLGAGRIDKAMSATIISMARVEDLWAITLDKESADRKLSRIRSGKERDRQKAERAKERANRSDRVSREDLEKAQDGTVGATIRIVTDESRERRGDTGAPAEEPKRESLLDKLGY